MISSYLCYKLDFYVESRGKLNQAKYWVHFIRFLKHWQVVSVNLTSYLPYSWSILSTSHSIGEHYQSFTSDTETEILSILQCLHFSNVRIEKYTFFCFLGKTVEKTTTPPIYTGTSKLIIETWNSGTQLKNRQEKCFSSPWLPKRKY